MGTVLLLATGGFWTWAYVLIIRRGIGDRTYGMPVVALCANLSWEALVAFVRPPTGPALVIAVLWLALDLAILGTVVRYGPAQFPNVSRPVFYAGLAVTLVLAYLCTDLASRQFDAGHGIYLAFIGNLVMSALFLSMLNARGGPAGQSTWVAATKLAGTACASIWTSAYAGYHQTPLLVFLYVAIFVLDVAYLAALVSVTGRGRAGYEA